MHSETRVEDLFRIPRKPLLKKAGAVGSIVKALNLRGNGRESSEFARINCTGRQGGAGGGSGQFTGRIAVDDAAGESMEWESAACRAVYRVVVVVR